MAHLCTELQVRPWVALRSSASKGKKRVPLFRVIFVVEYFNLFMESCVKQFLIKLCCMLSYLILSYLILSYHLILSYLILSYLILSYLILYLILSYLILSYLILSYLISYLILSYLIYLILSILSYLSYLSYHLIIYPKQLSLHEIQLNQNSSPSISRGGCRILWSGGGGGCVSQCQSLGEWGGQLNQKI